MAALIYPPVSTGVYLYHAGRPIGPVVSWTEPQARPMQRSQFSPHQTIEVTANVMVALAGETRAERLATAEALAFLLGKRGAAAYPNSGVILPCLFTHLDVHRPDAHLAQLEFTGDGPFWAGLMLRAELLAQLTAWESDMPRCESAYRDWCQDFAPGWGASRFPTQ